MTFENGLLRKLWNLFRSPPVKQAEFTVTTTSGKVLTNKKHGASSKTKRQSHTWINRPLKAIRSAGSYVIPYPDKITAEVAQRVASHRLHYRFGTGNYMTHINRAKQCIEVVVL